MHLLLVRLAQQAAAAPLQATPRRLQTQPVLSAQPLRETRHRGHQLVPPQRAHLPVRPNVELAEGRQAHQTGLDRPQLVLRRAEVARDVPGSTNVEFRGREHFAQLQFIDDLGEHSVPPQHRPGAECLPALGAAELTGLGLVPVVVNAGHAVGVSAGGGHRLLQDVQAHRTLELALCHRDTGVGHVSVTLASVALVLASMVRGMTEAAAPVSSCEGARSGTRKFPFATSSGTELMSC